MNIRFDGDKIKKTNMFLLLSSFVIASAVAFPQATNETEIETTTKYVYKPPTIGGCRLPPQPAHTDYEFIDPPIVEPGLEYDTIVLNVVCEPGYGLVDKRPRVVCYHGFGFQTLEKEINEKKCERFCAIPDEKNMEYRCPVKVMPPRCFQYMKGGEIHRVPCPIPEGADKGYRICKAYEPSGTVVQPVCKSGCSNDTFANMTCFKGNLIKESSNNNLNAVTAIIKVMQCLLSNKC